MPTLTPEELEVTAKSAEKFPEYKAGYWAWKVSNPGIPLYQNDIILHLQKLLPEDPLIT